MPEPTLEQLNDSAIARLDAELVGRLNGVRLSSEQLDVYKRNLKTGWRVPIAFSDGERQLDVLADGTVPFGPPKIALVDRPAALTWPHLEPDGVLCPIPTQASFDFRRPEHVVQELLFSSTKLIEDNISGQTQRDFQSEFHSYWIQAKPDGKPFRSLLTPRAPSRKAYAWLGEQFNLVADRPRNIVSWMANLFAKSIKESDLTPVALLWLAEPLFPHEYPYSARDVYAITKKFDEPTFRVLSQLISLSPRKLILVLCAPTDNGPALAGITVPAPGGLKFEGDARLPRIPGFRLGHAPPSLLIERYLGESTPTSRSIVERVDAAWIHGRGCDHDQPELARSRIVIVGYGSLGGHVAQLLAQAGIGKLDLVDPQILEWANVGRHPLGANHVGDRKASSLAAILRQSFPHSAFNAYDVTWQQVDRDHTDVLRTASVILNATGA